MTRAEAERAFGRVVESSQRRDGNLAVTTLVFDIGDQRLAAPTSSKTCWSNTRSHRNRF
jgi:hypothetical protein